MVLACPVHRSQAHAGHVHLHPQGCPLSISP
jgi:hypothetical protein